MRDRLRAIKNIKNLKQARELAMGVTGVLTDLMVKGDASSSCEYKHGDTVVNVHGCWTEDGVLRLDIVGLSRPKVGEGARDEG